MLVVSPVSFQSPWSLGNLAIVNYFPPRSEGIKKTWSVFATFQNGFNVYKHPFVILFHHEISMRSTTF